MQFSVHPSVEMMPCRIAFLFSDFVFHRFRQHASTSKSSTLIISFPSNFTANFLTIALPMLLTNVLLASTAEVNSMLKLRFAVPGMITSLLPKFGNLTSSSWAWSISLGLWVTITFCLVPFIPLGVLREHSGFNHFLYSILIGDYILRSRIWRTTVTCGPSVMILLLWSIILRFREVNSPFLSFLYCGVWGSKRVKSLSSVTW